MAARGKELLLRSLKIPEVVREMNDRKRIRIDPCNLKFCCEGHGLVIAYWDKSIAKSIIPDSYLGCR